MSPAPARPRPTRVLRGIGFVLLATVLFVVMNTGVKFLSPHLPTLEIIWARILGHLLFVAALFAPTHGGWRLLATRRPALQVSRSLLQLAATSLFFTALGRVPLADVTAVSFTSPLLVAALAAPVAGERVDRAQWVAVALGFAGALVVIRPTGHGASPYAFLVLGSATSYALYQLLTRRVAGVDAPETSATWSALVGALVLSLAVPAVWRAPGRPLHWLVLATLGLFGGLGHYCVARAMLWAPAAVVSPFHYAQLVWASLADSLIFGHVPVVWTWVGAAIIVGSGLFIVWRETHPLP